LQRFVANRGSAAAGVGKGLRLFVLLSFNFCRGYASILSLTTDYISPDTTQ
jgi:hypothetical protein